MHEGDQITTIEGLGTPEKLHPMQAGFLACDAYQCGYCTSGQMSAALMKEPCGPSDAAVKEAMSGNICRCGAYVNILEAIQTVRKARTPIGRLM
jgi:xanthine dehydrogenase YagT iron-sulfur-binding subunit